MRVFEEGESISERNVWLPKAELGEAVSGIYSPRVSRFCFAGQMGAPLTLISMYLQDNPEAAWELIQHLEEIICL